MEHLEKAAQLKQAKGAFYKDNQVRFCLGSMTRGGGDSSGFRLFAIWGTEFRDSLAFFTIFRVRQALRVKIAGRLTDCGDGTFNPGTENVEPSSRRVASLNLDNFNRFSQ